MAFEGNLSQTQKIRIMNSHKLIPSPQWKFSSQKGMKINLMAKAGLEPGTAEFPQRHELTIEPYS